LIEAAVVERQARTINFQFHPEHFGFFAVRELLGPVQARQRDRLFLCQAWHGVQPRARREPASGAADGVARVQMHDQIPAHHRHPMPRSTLTQLPALTWCALAAEKEAHLGSLLGGEIALLPFDDLEQGVSG